MADTGVGMDAETAERAFEPFFTTKPRGEGTGLGLATAFGVATQSGGTAWIESEPGKGTVVHVALPSATQALSQPDTVAGEPPVGSGEVVFVVEDNVELLLATQRMLSTRGYQVRGYSDGAAALSAMREDGGGPDLLLTDVVMPGQSGPELAVAARTLFPDLPVVFVSGHTAGLLEEYGAPVADGHLGKPFTVSALLEAVRAALDAARPTE